MPTSFEIAIGAPATVRIFDRDLQVGPITLAALGACAAEVRAQVQDPFHPLAVMLAALPPERALDIFRDVHQRHQQAMAPNPERCLAWAMDTASNFAFLLWLLLEERYRGQFSRDQIFHEIIRLRLERTSEYLAILQMVCRTSGVEIMGKLIAAGTPVIPALPAAVNGNGLPPTMSASGEKDLAGERATGGISSDPAMPAADPSPPLASAT